MITPSNDRIQNNVEIFVFFKASSVILSTGNNVRRDKILQKKDIVGVAR
jgi:hypothetical protein